MTKNTIYGVEGCVMTVMYGGLNINDDFVYFFTREGNGRKLYRISLLMFKICHYTEAHHKFRYHNNIYNMSNLKQHNFVINIGSFCL